MAVGVGDDGRLGTPGVFGEVVVEELVGVLADLAPPMPCTETGQAFLAQ
jgi:hypothetical protein